VGVGSIVSTPLIFLESNEQADDYRRNDFQEAIPIGFRDAWNTQVQIQRTFNNAGSRREDSERQLQHRQVRVIENVLWVSRLPLTWKALGLHDSIGGWTVPGKKRTVASLASPTP